MQWHYIKKYMSQGVQFTWKVSYLFHKVHNFCTMPLYYVGVVMFFIIFAHIFYHDTIYIPSFSEQYIDNVTMMAINV